MLRRVLSCVTLAVMFGCGQPATGPNVSNQGSSDADVDVDANVPDMSVDLPPGCGNGVLDDGERCDPAIESGDGACPTEAECDRGGPCTVGELVDGGTCQALCIEAPVANCCGDGSLNGVETCDRAIAPGMPGACPEACDDTDPCTTDELREPGTCLAQCVHTQQPICFGSQPAEQVPGTDGSAYPPELLAHDGELWLFASAARNDTIVADVVWHRWDGLQWLGEESLQGDTYVGITATTVGARPTIFAVTGTDQPWVNAYNGANASTPWEWSTLNASSWKPVLTTNQTSSIVGAAAVNERVFLFTKTIGDVGSIEFAAALAEGNFEDYRTVPGGETTRSGPAAFADGSEVTLVVAGTSNLRAARYDSSADSWTGWIDYGPAISGAGAPDVLREGGLTVVSANAGGTVSVAFSEDDGTTWSEWTTLAGDDVVGRPSLAMYGGKLYVAVLRDAGPNAYWLHSAPLP